MPKLTAEYLKRARTLILDNLNNFIKEKFNDKQYEIQHPPRNIISKRINVIKMSNDGTEMELYVSVKRNVYIGGENPYEDYVALIVGNVNGEDIICKVDLKWKYNMIGGRIIPQFEKNFSIHKQDKKTDKNLLTCKMKEFYERYINYNDEIVDFEFNFN